MPDLFISSKLWKMNLTYGAGRGTSLTPSLHERNKGRKEGRRNRRKEGRNYTLKNSIIRKENITWGGRHSERIYLFVQFLLLD